MEEQKQGHKILKGIAVSPGVAYGRVCIYGDIHTVPRYTIRAEEVKDELVRLDKAIQESSRELEEIRRRVEAEVGKEEADIFLAHQMMLEDMHFYAQVEQKMKREHLNVEAFICIEESAVGLLGGGSISEEVCEVCSVKTCPPTTAFKGDGYGLCG